MDRELDAALRHLAEKQHGLVGRSQARGLGATGHNLQRRLGSPDWEAVTSKVLRLAGSPETFHQRCMAAVLDAAPGSVISHLTAARLWRLPGFTEDVIHVSRLRGTSGRRTSVAILHEPRCLPPDHMTVLDGIPLTAVPRTLFDLAGVIGPARVERAVDNAIARQLTSARRVNAVKAELAKQGRTGSRLLREVLAERGDAYRPVESGLEARFLRLLRASGLPEPRRQCELGGDRWVGRVDFLYPEANLVIEVDSSLHHSTLLDREADARRDTELAAAGFRVCRVRDGDVWHRPDAVVDAVRAALAAVAA